MTSRSFEEKVDASQCDVLAIDLGTGGPKVGIISLDGNVRWHAHQSVTTRRIGTHGAVQDPNDWWDVISDMIRDALASPEVNRVAIAALSITGQYASTVPVNAAGEPIGDCLLWMDSRGRQIARKRFGGRTAGYDARMVAKWVRHSGGAPALSGADPIGHRLFLQHEYPQITERARWMLEPIDHLAMRFTGVAAATPASMATAWLIDTRRSDACVYDVELVQRSGINARQLPPLMPSASVIGRVLPQVADQLGLPEGIKVVASLPDLHTAALGSGAVGDKQGHLAISTSAWISAPVQAKKTDVLHQIATVPGLAPNQYLIIDNHEVGGLALDWFRQSVMSAQGATPDYGTTIALAEQAEPGAGNVLFTPWLSGERSPVDDSLARGGFHNLSMATGPEHMARAVLEGVALNARWLNEAVEAFASIRFEPLRVIGGGAQSDLWCQIHADVLQRTLERPEAPRIANLRGAAFAAGIALGAYTLADVPGLVGHVDRFTPNPKTRTVYDRLATQFAKRYRADKAMFRALNTD